MKSNEVRMNDLEVVAIGTPSTARNQNLAGECLENGLDVHWTPSIVVSNSLAEYQTFFAKVLSYAINGRQLNSGEIGCAMAHRSCYVRHAENNSEWMLILEDDATLDDGAGLLVKSLATLRMSPAIVLLFQNLEENVTVTPKSNKLVRSETYPSGAVGYLINKSASRIALEDTTSPLAPADFPPFQTKVTFYRTANTSPVKEIASNSMIGHQVFSSLDVLKIYFCKLAFGPLACLLGAIRFSDWLSFAIVRPFVRDFKSLMMSIGKGRK